MKFSIVIPVYNVEKYLDKCLNSICKQTYKDFEVIIVNDGSPDNSQAIIDKYVKKDSRFQAYQKENGGLSDARNYGIERCKGDYLLFVDSDDYIEKDLLKELSTVLKKEKYDVIKFKLRLADENGEILEKEDGFAFSKEINLSEMLTQVYSDLAWTYCYNLTFWHKHKFQFAKGKIHEDFGLVPFILYQSTSIYYLNYYGYNYVQRKGSIMNCAEKTMRRVQDKLYHFDFLYQMIQKAESPNIEYKDELISYIANGLVYGAVLLNGKNLKDYIKELKKRNVFDLILDDTPKRKIKKRILKISPLFYIKIFLKG